MTAQTLIAGRTIERVEYNDWEIPVVITDGNGAPVDLATLDGDPVLIITTLRPTPVTQVATSQDFTVTDADAGEGFFQVPRDDTPEPGMYRLVVNTTADDDLESVVGFLKVTKGATPNPTPPPTTVGLLQVYGTPSDGDAVIFDLAQLRAEWHAIDPAGSADAAQAAAEAYALGLVQTLEAQLTTGAPGALNTLDELAAALGDDANFAATVVNALAGKQPSSAVLTALANNGTPGAKGLALLLASNAPTARTELGFRVAAPGVTGLDLLEADDVPEAWNKLGLDDAFDDLDIALRWRGVYSGAVAYSEGDGVSDGSASWRALRASTGVTPIEGLDWTLLAGNGADAGEISITARLETSETLTGVLALTDVPGLSIAAPSTEPMRLRVQGTALVFRPSGSFGGVTQVFATVRVARGDGSIVAACFPAGPMDSGAYNFTAEVSIDVEVTPVEVGEVFKVVGAVSNANIAVRFYGEDLSQEDGFRISLGQSASVADAAPSHHAAQHGPGQVDEIAISGAQITTGTVPNARLDATLADLAALTTAANKTLYWTGADTAALTDLTSQARQLMDDTSFGAMLTTLGVSTFVKTLLDDVDAAAFLATLGADWVLAASASASVAGSETTTSTSYTDLTTSGPAPSFTVPSNGKAKVTVTASIVSPTQASATATMSFALSGANTLAAGSGPFVVQSTSGGAPVGVLASRTVILTGLTPGATTFTAKYRVSAGTGTFALRNILVEAVA